MIKKGAWPWLEGVILATVVAAILLISGEAVRASYHGYLHTSIGESVLRDGLIPENPYHAGTSIRYYTLYPSLGPLLGQLGLGPIGSFALLNVIAALLFGPAWNAFSAAAGLCFRQRRASFWAAILGFNALGWLGWVLSPPDPNATVPIFSFLAMTMDEHSWAWDARLQSFLPKFLNVSSFALALPFMLWAMAPAIRADGKAMSIILPLAVGMAINPLAGGFAVICIALWKFQTLLRGPVGQRLQWPLAGVVAGIIALPFLLPLFQPAPTGESLTGTVRFQHDGLMNFVGPMFLLLIPGALGMRQWKREVAWKWGFALLIAITIMAFARLPWGNQYKLARIAGLLWAIPVGRWAAQSWQGAKWQKALPIALLLLSLPTTFLVAKTYLGWGSAAGPASLNNQGGQLVLNAQAATQSWPSVVQQAEAEADDFAVLWMHPFHPGSRAGNGVVQGNALAPILHRALFVDEPQIHNNQLEDLPLRRQLSFDLWGSEPPAKIRQAGQAAIDVATQNSKSALLQARGLLPTRPFLILNHDGFSWTSQALVDAAAEKLATEYGISLWLLPALQPVAEN